MDEDLKQNLTFVDSRFRYILDFDSSVLAVKFNQSVHFSSLCVLVKNILHSQTSQIFSPRCQKKP